MLSGCRNSLSPSMCLTALAPCTTGPSIAVVRNTLFAQTTGEEWPRPAIAVFHLMFLVTLHSAGRFFSVEIPRPPGPRHCGQFGVAELTTIELENITAARRQIAKGVPVRITGFISETS